MKKRLLSVGLILSSISLTGCYDFNRQQDQLDRQSEGKGILMKAQYEKKAKIEEAKVNLESAKLNAKTKVIKAKADLESEIIKAKARATVINGISETLRSNPEYIKFLTVDAMYNHGKTIYIPTEAGLPIIERK